jgi:hypothetical protein
MIAERCKRVWLVLNGSGIGRMYALFLKNAPLVYIPDVLMPQQSPNSIGAVLKTQILRDEDISPIENEMRFMESGRTEVWSHR